MPKKPEKRGRKPLLLRPSTFQTQDRIAIGPWRIVISAQGGTAWVLHEDGEGMQTTAAKLEAMIEAFWKKEF